MHIANLQKEGLQTLQAQRLLQRPRHTTRPPPRLVGRHRLRPVVFEKVIF